MTINLTKDLERFVRDAVRDGRYAREEDVIRDALTRLRQATPEDTATSGKSINRGKPAQPQKNPLTKDEFHRHLVELGLMSQLPDIDADFDDPDDQPVSIEGEPLSDTVIRERR